MKYYLLLLTFVTCHFTPSAQGYRTSNSANEKKSTYEHPKLGKNIISFSPVQIVLTNIEQDAPDVAVAFSYERIFKNELVSFKLPVSLSLTDNFFYVMPVLKLYPMKQGIAKYAVGPQLLFGSGDGTYQDYYQDQTSGIYYTKSVTTNHKQFGFLINNSINFTIAKSLYVGLDASLGIIYYDNLPKDVYYYGSGITPFSNTNSNISPAFQLNFNMGFRF